jgi:hypothetical protein
LKYEDIGVERNRDTKGECFQKSERGKKDQVPRMGVALPIENKKVN